MRTISLWLVLAVAAFTTGCGGGSPNPPQTTCRNQNSPCGVSADCCGGLLCLNAICDVTLANGCPGAAPIDCGNGSCCANANPICCAGGKLCGATQADCGSTCRAAGQTCGSGCCAGLQCSSGVCAKSASCTGKACTNSANCCGGYVCSRYGHTCVAAQNLKSLDPCTSDSQCAAGGNLCYSGISGNDGATINSWCSLACASDADCGNAGYCVLDSQDHYRCFPFCQSNADCTVYGPSITCKMGTDTSGLNLPVCSG